MEPERQVSVPPGQTGPSSEAGWSHLAAGTSLFVGLLLIIMGLAHLYGVIVTATMRSYAYDFRLAALLLLGMALVFAAALCLSAVRGLARRQRAAWGRALIGTLLLLLVLVPLGPVQPDMAPGLSVLAAVNLIALLAARRGLEAG
jgi:heme/copper-type cytochrome/quinol oxidase subunit 3